MLIGVLWASDAWRGTVQQRPRDVSAVAGAFAQPKPMARRHSISWCGYCMLCASDWSLHLRIYLASCGRHAPRRHAATVRARSSGAPGHPCRAAPRNRARCSGCVACCVKRTADSLQRQHSRPMCGAKRAAQHRGARPAAWLRRGGACRCCLARRRVGPHLAAGALQRRLASPPRHASLRNAMSRRRCALNLISTAWRETSGCCHTPFRPKARRYDGVAAAPSRRHGCTSTCACPSRRP